METATKERPILFSAPMVRAILDGRKTMTRRVVKPQPPEGYRSMVSECDVKGGWWFSDMPRRTGSYSLGEHAKWNNVYPKCPYGAPGDSLWIRSAYHVRYDEERDETHWTAEGLWVTTHGRPRRNDGAPMKLGVKPAMHMPYWLSLEGYRITLEITGVRVERLQDISEADAVAEGCPECEQCKFSPWGRGAYDDPLSNAAGGKPWGPCFGVCGGKTAQEWFRDLWQSINGKTHPWDSNPWVWVVEFRVATQTN